MTLQTRACDFAESISLPDRLDAAVAPAVRDELRDIIAAGRNRLILDLSDVTFMDSSGLSVLVTVVKVARSSGGEVVLLRLTPMVRSLIEVTRLHRVFRIFEDETAALAALTP